MIWRKLLSVLFFIATLQTVHAQIPKGTIMTGGNLGFQFKTNKERSGSFVNFGFNPYLGGFVAKNFVLGIAPMISYFQQIGHSSGVSGYPFSSFTIGAGPFARYYLKIGEKAYVFFHAAPLSLAAEWDHNYQDKTQPYTRLGVINWAVGPGLSIMVAKGIAVEVGAYYDGTWHQTNLYQKGNLLGNPGTSYVDHGMVLNVGMQVYFERKAKEKQAAK